ncbi:Exchange factor for Arf-6 [Caenorhabditis elegans]|uniref:Isoform a of Exchange factor for Arf-6 n=1 Tax=Caenorhabditis elegans TaxID=6239 RepID=G5EET6-2|nr:Exchange factor for Arf-6 [Caenorhabditis elegans]CAA21701.1 Exchange factor for Arf-6 [Caenorhabditis elegans]|eukprot:NP_502417.1 Exchange factor for Arf-6 [Caenorhabditis elegans]
MAKVASSGAEEALATIDGAPRRNVKKSEAFVMSGDVLISLNRNVSSTYAKLLGDQLPPGTTVASSIHPHQLSRATASAGVSFPSMNRNGAAAQKLSRLPVSTSQIERRGSLARKTSEESSPTAIRMLKTAPIERMESTDVEESEEETVMMTTDEKENQKKPNENDDEVMVVDEEQFIVVSNDMKSPNEEIVAKSLRSAMFTMPTDNHHHSYNSSPQISTLSPHLRSNGDGPSRSPVYDDVDDDLNGSLDAKDMSNNSHQQSFRSPENYSEKDTPSKHSVVTIDGSGVSNHYDQDGMFSHVYYSTQDTTPKHGSPSLRKQIFESRTTPNTAASNSSASASPSLHATSESRGATGGVSLRSAESSNLNQTAVPSTSTNSVGGEREAAQIARNLYELKNCTSTQVADRLNEQNEFSFLILVKYLELFQFSTTRIDAALREFLSRVELRGESSARERLLRVFSARYLECNPAIFDSLDEVHTLTCALLLLNSDLHGPNMGKKMTARDFITNIAHTGCTFKREMLKTLFQSIKDNAISLQNSAKNSTANGSVASTSRRQPQQIYEVDPDSVVEYYSGFLMRKYVRETDGGKTPFGRRSWRMVYARLRGLVLYFDTDEHPKATSRYASLENAVSLHHALAEPAPDYKKKSFVFRVRIAHGGEILFQTSNQKELQEWCEKINFVAAAFSSPTLPLPVTSKPETAPMPRLPRIPCLAPITKQLSTHEARVAELNEMIEIVSQSVSPNQPQQLITDRWVLLSFEKRRYSTYINVLRRSLEARKASSATTMNIMMTPTRRQQQNQKPVVSEDRLSYTDAVNGAAAH